MGAYLYLRYATPVFQSTSALFVKGSSSEDEGAANDRFSQLFVLDHSINIQSEIELIKSKPLMQKVVDNLGLNFQYYSKGKIDDVHHYGDLPFRVETLMLKDAAQPFALDISFIENESFLVAGDTCRHVFNQPFATPQGRFKLVPTQKGGLSEAYRAEWWPSSMLAGELASQLVVAPKGGTGILNLVLETTHPQLSADVLNQLMHAYQVTTIEDKNETKRQTIAFVNDRLQVVSRELDSLTALLLAYQKQTNLLDPGSQSAAYLARMDAIDEQARTQNAQVAIAKIITAYLSDGRNNFTVVPSTLGLADGTLNTLISAYNLAQLEHKGLLDSKVPVGNARVQQLEKSIEQLRLNILEALRNLVVAIRDSGNRMNREKRAVAGRAQQLPVQEQNLLELKRQLEMKQSVYKILMEKREESAISLAATISNIKVVEAAAPVPLPVRPEKGNAKLLAIFIGLALPAGFIFVKELLNDKINSRADLEKLTSVPILAEVGHTYAEEMLVARPGNRSMVAEQFRTLRSNLQYVVPAKPCPVILVTSTSSGEGKSFVSANLGAVLAMAGKKTIVLELDIRKPNVLQKVGLSRKPGLTNWLVGKVAMEDLPVQVAGYENLDVLPCGAVPPNPSELLLHPQLDTLFQWLRSRYDAIVIDTAPVGIVSDALNLARFADATLYITRQGHTFKRQVKLIADFAVHQKLPALSVVLNDVQLDAAFGYYGYGRYGYAYGGGAGYFDPEQPGGGGNKKRNFLQKEKT